MSVRPHDEPALVLEWEAVGVQQVSRGRCRPATVLPVPAVDEVALVARLMDAAGPDGPSSAGPAPLASLLETLVARPPYPCSA
jgi:hypothetical protein